MKKSNKHGSKKVVKLNKRSRRKSRKKQVAKVAGLVGILGLGAVLYRKRKQVVSFANRLFAKVVPASEKKSA